MFERKPLRDDVQQEILARLWDGRLTATQRINETRLATEMGVSRTPLREAMIYLAAAGYLESDLGRGFKVPALDVSDFRQIDAVLGILIPAALVNCGPLQPEHLMELTNLLGRARMQGDAWRGCAQLEFGFIAVLMQGQANRLLARDILRLAGLARRYWQTVAAEVAAAEYIASLADVYEALRNGRHDTAAERWRSHGDRFAASVIAKLT